MFPGLTDAFLKASTHSVCNYMSDLKVKDLWFLMVLANLQSFVAEKVKDLDKEVGQYTGKKGGKPTTLCSSKWSNIMVLINTPYNNNNSHKGNNNIAIYGRVISFHLLVLHQRLVGQKLLHSCFYWALLVLQGFHFHTL